MAPGYPGSWLRHCLEHTGHAVTSKTESLYFRGNPASLEYVIPRGGYSGHSSHASNLLCLLQVQLLEVLPEFYKYDPGCGKQRGLPQANLRCFSMYPDRMRTYPGHPHFSFPLSKPLGYSF